MIPAVPVNPAVTELAVAEDTLIFVSLPIRPGLATRRLQWQSLRSNSSCAKVPQRREVSQHNTPRQRPSNNPIAFELRQGA